MTKKHNYPKTRKPTGPRPNAGRKAQFNDRWDVSISFEREELQQFKAKYGKDWQEKIRYFVKIKSI